MRIRQLLLSVCALAFAPTASPYSCLSESGAAVDWFVAFTKGSSDPGYYYVDSTNVESGFKLSANVLSSTSSGSIMNTVGQIYSSSTTAGTALVQYSDEPPGAATASSTYAHAKGVLLSGASQGFWFVHSKPNWPNARLTGPGPFPDFTYAQSAMCVTLAAAEVDKVAALEAVVYPYVYDRTLTPELEATFPNFKALAATSRTKSSLAYTSVSLTSASAAFPASFKAFGKSAAWGKDLYEDLVAPSLSSDLYVETWRNGAGGRMPSFCTSSSYSGLTVPYNVLFVNKVQMPDGVSWTGTKDHSKWAVTLPRAGASEEKYACVGDLNRMCSQESRGGGTLCLKSDSLWQSFTNAVAATDGCWNYDVCATSYQCYWCDKSAPATTTKPKDSCGGLVPGDIQFIGYNAIGDAPADHVVLVTLVDIPLDAKLWMTDNAYMGPNSGFRSGEGIISYATSSATGVIKAGTVMSSQVPNTPAFTVSGSFSLLATGDNIHVYCYDIVGEAESAELATTPTYLASITYGALGWKAAELTSTEYGTSSSALPTGVVGTAGIALPQQGFYYYNGIRSGSSSDLRAAILNIGNWVSPTSWDATKASAAFSVVIPPSPTRTPSKAPTTAPTRVPNRSPSRAPTRRPSTTPTAEPSRTPSIAPTGSPTRVGESRRPSRAPSRAPTAAPTPPTRRPTRSPSRMPTAKPSRLPTRFPTRFPTSRPTRLPTLHPSSAPSFAPTAAPSRHHPSRAPTSKPTGRPSRLPTLSPSKRPTRRPSRSPTVSPTEKGVGNAPNALTVEVSYPAAMELNLGAIMVPSKEDSADIFDLLLEALTHVLSELVTQSATGAYVRITAINGDSIVPSSERRHRRLQAVDVAYTIRFSVSCDKEKEECSDENMKHSVTSLIAEVKSGIVGSTEEGGGFGDALATVAGEIAKSSAVSENAALFFRGIESSAETIAVTNTFVDFNWDSMTAMSSSPTPAPQILFFEDKTLDSSASQTNGSLSIVFCAICFVSLGMLSWEAKAFVDKGVKKG